LHNDRRRPKRQRLGAAALALLTVAACAARRETPPGRADFDLALPAEPESAPVELAVRSGAGEIELPALPGGYDRIEILLERPVPGSLRLELRVASAVVHTLEAIPAFPGARRYVATLATDVDAPETLRIAGAAAAVANVRLWPPLAREQTRDGVTRPCRAARSVRVDHVRLGGGHRVRVGVARGGPDAPARGAGALIAVWRSAAGEERWRRELEPVGSWQDVWLTRDDDAEIGTLELRAELPAIEGACFSRPVPAAPPPPRPANVVLVSIDTLRADALADAPALRERAAAGRSFAAAYALSNWTLPSHAGLLVARSYLDHGLPLSGENAAFAYPEGRLSPGWTTLAEAFRDAGYATFASTEGGYLDPKFGFARGFDGYAVVPALTVDRDARFQAHVERIRDFVREGRGGRPFFVFLHTYRVHDYLLNTSEYQCELAGGDPGLRARGDLNPQWAAAGAGGASAFAALPLDYARSLYRCGVAATDRRVEEAVRSIEAALGRRERLLVAYTSDHGESFGERERVVGHGTSLHEEQIRVPLVLWANDGSVAPERVEAPVSALDLAPTLLAWAGVPAPASFRGRASLLGGGSSPSAVEAMASGLAGSFHERYLAWARIGPETRFERRDRADGSTDRRRCERRGAGSTAPVPAASCAQAEGALASELEKGGEWTWIVRALRPGDLLLRVDLGRTRVAAVVASPGSSAPLLDATSGVVRFSARREGETLLIFVRGDQLALERAEWDGAPLERAAWPTEPGAGAILQGPEGAVLRVERRSPAPSAAGAAPSPEEVERLERELRALGYLQ